MVVVSETRADVSEQVDPPSAVRERAEGFAVAVLSEAMGHPVQIVNGGLYLRGLLEQGERKSLEPLVARLGGEADYQSMQQFLADSPWDPVAVIRAVCERVAPGIDVEAWVLDDTGFPKDGKHSPGVKRQYSGTLGKIGNCQIGVSLHAVGTKATVPLGWALYLPEGAGPRREDAERRRKAKIPADVAVLPPRGPSRSWGSGWRCAPLAGSSAKRPCSATRRTEITPSCVTDCTWAAFSTCSRSPRRRPCSRRIPSSSRPSHARDRAGAITTLYRTATPSRSALIARLGERHLKTVTFGECPNGTYLKSRFMFVRVRAAHHWRAHDGRGRWDKGAAEIPPREEWLIAEWPKGRSEPTDYWISNLPRSTKPWTARAARAAALEDRARLPPAQRPARP